MAPIELIEPTMPPDEAAVEVASEVVDPAPAGSAVALLSPIQLIKAGVADVVKLGTEATWDVNTKEGDKAAREFRANCVKIRTSAQAAYELGNKPLLDAQRKARKLVAEITEDIDKVESIWDARIRAVEDRKAREKAEREQKERERIAGIRQLIEGITAAPVAAARVGTSAEAAFYVRELESMVIDAERYGEFVDEAEGARQRALATTVQLRDAALEREAEAARLEAQRLEQERIAAELKRQQEQAAAEAAARQAEIDRQLAERQAELDRQAAELKRMQDEAQDRLEAERRAAAEAEAARERAAAEQREQHQRAQAELQRQRDAFEAEQREAAERLARERREAEERRQAELAEIERQAQASQQKQFASAAPDVGTEIEPQAEAAAPAAQDAQQLGLAVRPTDEEILDALCQHFQAGEAEVLEWISQFSVEAQMLRLEEAA
jgi:hypothetical protein